MKSLRLMVLLLSLVECGLTEIEGDQHGTSYLAFKISLYTIPCLNYYLLLVVLSSMFLDLDLQVVLESDSWFSEFLLFWGLRYA